MPDQAHELLERYEATGDEDAFEDARRRFEDAGATTPDAPGLRLAYDYLLECHGRYAIRRAAEHSAQARTRAAARATRQRLVIISRIAW